MENPYLLISLVPAVLILAWLVLVAYPEYRADQFRQELFILRDKLFDEAARGRISFDHPAYGYLRTTMNGYLRFAHELGLLDFILMSLALRQHETKALFSDQFDRYVQNLPVELRKDLHSYRQYMQHLVLKKIIFGSVTSSAIFFLPFLARRVYARCKQYVDNNRFVPLVETPKIQHRFERFDLAAHQYGRAATV